MANIESLPQPKKIAYAIGQFGWSTLVNIIGLQLVYFYIPPKDSGIKIFITQITFLAVLNVITIISSLGRLWDAITDPLIANISDRWKGKSGRRVPFLRVGALFTGIFCLLMFLPIVPKENFWNIIWLFLMQTLFYLFLTIYVTPFFALLPELGHNSNERLILSTYISITYALGIMIAGQTNLIANIISSIFKITDKVLSLQIAIGFLCAISMILMFVPVIFIDEKRYCESVPSDIPLFKAFKKTFKNREFIFYIIADFSYFMGLTIIMTGLLYYITVLLKLPDSLMAILLPIMVLLSFVCYPLVALLAKRFGKKIFVVIAFLWMSSIFFAIFFLGKMPLSEMLQAYLLIILYSIPLSFLGILPNAILADIAEYDAKITGVKQEGMFFAARTLMQKFGQTLGIFVFAMLTTFGKDIGNDLGIRLSGIVGFILCLVAGISFLGYNEKKVMSESDKKIS